MLYFTYGSNLDSAQMRQRCPSAQFVAIAKLPRHRLAFTRNSVSRKCGVADAVPDDAATIWGAVFAIAETDIGGLDKSEGFRPGRPAADNSYNREERHVWRNGNENDPLLVSIYFANRQTNVSPPNTGYKRLIVDGARFWHLPADYLATLDQIEIGPAPDRS